MTQDDNHEHKQGILIGVVGTTVAVGLASYSLHNLLAPGIQKKGFERG